ncbi:DUF4405 domain-containing protein [Desulfolutivibrio sulfoxidireducens]|uniref:DUF4405 domain-containing protein n=1 Tax=Desulfolutivibrio sulfoxidireducens TaxID=2773299 RepID=UPI00159E739B|nr:DUF4405 domain-containing protein [Desulfolutivibrio sulfoxidireducens]QLA15255.1 DUF4405 domain-containing protein [Desulfolutivibrio sulfoxidireducens]
MLRKIMTLTLVLAFAVLFLTSVFLFLAPHARVAAWADWTLLGLTRDRWTDVHVTMGFLLLLAGAVHLVLDWPSILDSLRSEDGEVEPLSRPLLAAFALTLFVFVGTLLGLPPMAQILGLSTHIKDSLSETYGEPPYGHAELTPLDEFCRRFGIDQERAMAALAMKNIRVASAKQTIKDIARDNGLAPGGVYEGLKHAWEASRTVTVPSTSAPASAPQSPRPQPSVMLPKDPPPGLGKRRLSDICEEYGLDLARMTDTLRSGGIEASAAMTLKEIADKNGLLPIDVYEALRAEGPIKRPAGNGSAHSPAHVQPQAQAPAQLPVQHQPQIPTQSPAQHQAQIPTQTTGQAQAPAQSPVQPQTQFPGQVPGQTQMPAQIPGQVPGQTQTPAQIPGQVPGQTQTPAQHQTQTSAQSPVQPQTQFPGQVPGQTQTPAQVQIPAQVPGQLPSQIPGNLPLPGVAPSETWRPGYERPSSLAEGGPLVPPPDLDKTMLATFCREFDIPLTMAIDRLAAKNVTAFGDMTFQELALENNMTPDEVMRVIITP